MPRNSHHAGSDIEPHETQQQTQYQEGHIQRRPPPSRQRVRTQRGEAWGK